MSINITPEIEAAYKAHLDEQVDADLMGKTIRRRDTYPYIAFSGLVIFAAGFQAARTAPTSAAGATNPNELTSSPEPAPALRAAEWVERAMDLAGYYAEAIAAYRMDPSLKTNIAGGSAREALRAHLSPASGLLPVAREGLSDDEIRAAVNDCGLMFTLPDIQVARAIEAEHGIAPASGDAPGEAK